MVEDTRREVGVGTAQVGRSQAAFRKIAASTSEFADQVNAMCSSFGAQAHQLDQVNSEVTTFSTMTQQNAAQCEELSGMSEALRAQSDMLETVSQRFHVGHAAA